MKLAWKITWLCVFWIWFGAIVYLALTTGDLREAELETLRWKRIQCYDRGGYMAMYSPTKGDCLHPEWKGK